MRTRTALTAIAALTTVGLVLTGCTKEMSRSPNTIHPPSPRPTTPATVSDDEILFATALIQHNDETLDALTALAGSDSYVNDITVALESENILAASVLTEWGQPAQPTAMLTQSHPDLQQTTDQLRALDTIAPAVRPQAASQLLNQLYCQATQLAEDATPALTDPRLMALASSVQSSRTSWSKDPAGPPCSFRQ